MGIREVGIREVGPELQLGRERSDLEDRPSPGLGRHIPAGDERLALAAACTRKKSLKSPR